MIENSPGTRLFNSLIVKLKDTGEVKDVFGDGDNSCAAFVSSVLFLNRLLDEPHATVARLRQVLTRLGWQKVEGDIIPGDVVFWEKIKVEDGSEHEHVGFALSADEAISTSYKERQVVKHAMIPNGRKVTEVFRPNILE